MNFTPLPLRCAQDCDRYSCCRTRIMVVSVAQVAVRRFVARSGWDHTSLPDASAPASWVQLATTVNSRCTANRRADRIEHCRPRNSPRSQHQQIRRDTLRQQRIGCPPQCLIQPKEPAAFVFVLIEQDAQHTFAPQHRRHCRGHRASTPAAGELPAPRSSAAHG